MIGEIQTNEIVGVTEKSTKFNTQHTRNRVVTPVKGDSVTDTSWGNDTDVNKIVERFSRTGHLPEPKTQPYYGDVTELQDDMDILIAKTEKAREQLEALENEKAMVEKARIEAEQKELEEYRAAKAAETTPTPDD